jgi:hypothetical protein
MLQQEPSFYQNPNPETIARKEQAAAFETESKAEKGPELLRADIARASLLATGLRRQEAGKPVSELTQADVTRAA